MEKKEEFFEILIGQSEVGASRYRVICDRSELEVVAGALIRYEKFIRKANVACVAKQGYDASFSDYDVMICDCM
jgi:hypothetical protein